MLKIFLYTIFIISIAACRAFETSGPEERQIISQCLSSFGGLTPDNAKRLQRYKHWSDTYEEIPCFTNCYLNKMFDIYNETTGFNEQNVIKHFGQSVYEECKYRLRSYGRSSCELAYNGLHCLVSLENDPFIMIESMQSLNVESKTAMKDCLRKFDESNWPLLKDYASFPVQEPIPCYTKCFLDKLDVYDYHTRRWDVQAMRYKLSIPQNGANFDSCLKISRRRNRNSCAWLYNEFTCFALSK